MNKVTFDSAFNLIVGSKNSVALINIDEFERLERVQGEYKWIPFEIGFLPAIPVITSDFVKVHVNNDKLSRTKITPIWSFLSNKAKIITPNIESFVFTEYTKPSKRYTLEKASPKNPNYLTARNWGEIDNLHFAAPENAVQWNKQVKSALLASTDKNFLALFLKTYKDELEEFNKLYEDSVAKTKELKNLQRKSPKF